MHRLIEYSENYWKTSRSLYQFCIDETHDNIAVSESWKFKSKFLGNTNNEGVVNAKIALSLKYYRIH